MTNDRIVVDSVKDHLCWRAALISSISLQTCCRRNQLPEKNMHGRIPSQGASWYLCLYMCVFKHKKAHYAHIQTKRVMHI